MIRARSRLEVPPTAQLVATKAVPKHKRDMREQRNNRPIASIATHCSRGALTSDVCIVPRWDQLQWRERLYGTRLKSLVPSQSGRQRTALQLRHDYHRLHLVS